jgi:hypothetical protein
MEVLDHKLQPASLHFFVGPGSCFFIAATATSGLAIAAVNPFTTFLIVSGFLGCQDATPKSRKRMMLTPFSVVARTVVASF